MKSALAWDIIGGMNEIPILVVDDSAPVRELVVKALSDRGGYTLREAADGAEAVEMILADPPALILLDLEMPHLNGFQVLDTLRAQESDIPVILMTSHGSEAIAVEVFRKGVKDYLIKPFSLDEMYAAIDRALTEVRLRQEKEALNRHLAAANQQLRRRVRELDTLYKVGKSVTALLAREQLLSRILDAVFFVIDAEEATLMLMDEESGLLHTELHRRRSDRHTDYEAPAGAEELGRRAANKGDATSTGAMLSIPLKVGRRVVGALGVSNLGVGRPFTQHDRQLLMALGDYAAIAIENARLYEGVQEANRAKSEFVSVVAHELRTPMTSIRGYADLLLGGGVGPLTPQQEEFVRTIVRNVERMQILVSDLRDISRMETGQLRLERKAVPLLEPLRLALHSVKQQMEAHGQQLTIAVPDDLPLVYADPARLTQIFTNLLSNAHKYTPDGGQITVRAEREGGYVRCSVSDTGIGMSPEDLGRLFTKFFRSDDPAVREKPGTGLGLCIFKNLVELQGGTVSVDSVLGQGTTFSFTVPVAYRDTGR